MPVMNYTGIVAGKIETTAGTAIALAAADAGFRVINPVYQPVGDAVLNRSSASFQGVGVTPGGYSGKMSFGLELYGAASGAPKWASILLPACGFVDAAGGDVEYALTGDISLHKTLTLGLQYTGILREIMGAMGTFTLAGSTDGQCMAMFDFIGAINGSPSAAVSTVTYEASKPGLCNGSNTATIGGTAHTVANWNLSGLVAALLPSVNVAGGVARAFLQQPDLRISMNVGTEAAQDWFASYLAKTESALSLKVLGGTGTAITISTAKASLITSPQFGADGSRLTDSLEFAILDPLKIKFE